jgi:hypothetical protein
MSDLQFDKAEFASPAAAKTCALGREPITDAYYEVGGAILCPACREKLGRDGGNAAFVRAIVWGGGAALLGTFAWFMLMKLAHIELGILGIAVGYFVGKTVRRASGNLGGAKYQALAMVLTYLSIVGSYVPFIADSLQDASPLTLIRIAVAQPFSGGMSNIMGLVIIGIALYEAWKLNRPLPITGPFRVAASPEIT